MRICYNMLPKKKTTKCVFSIYLSKETRTKADELGKKFDRSRSKIIEMAVNNYHNKLKYDGSMETD